MKKTKKYVSPEMNVVKLDVAPLLCGSGNDNDNGTTATGEGGVWG